MCARPLSVLPVTSSSFTSSLFFMFSIGVLGLVYYKLAKSDPGTFVCVCVSMDVCMREVCVRMYA